MIDLAPKAEAPRRLRRQGKVAEMNPWCQSFAELDSKSGHSASATTNVKMRTQMASTSSVTAVASAHVSLSLLALRRK